MTDHDYLAADVLIVGAGPTGLLLANLLGTMGVSTLIVEKNATTVLEPRAVSIDDESLRALQAASLDTEMARIMSRGYGSLYRGPDGSVFATVKPWQQEYGFDRRNAFEQPNFENILRSALPRHASVQAVFSAEVLDFDQDAEGVTATISRSDGKIAARARYLVACDGGRSRVRKTLGIALSGSSFEEPWLIVDLHSTRNRCFHTEVLCNPLRSCITLPGPGGIRRYEFKLNPGETAAEAETEEFVRKLLASVGPDEHEPLRRVRVYTFHARSAEKWRDRRIFLAGDAAHLTPPFAGQGMNSGLRDAHNLAWKLDEALRASDPEPILASYEVERKPHAWEMIQLALRMGKVMMPTSRLAGTAIRTGFRLLGLYPPARDYFAQMKYKPKPRFADGLLWADGRTAAQTIVGRMIPQPLVDTTARDRVLLDDILPDRPVALVFAERPEEAVPAEVRRSLGLAGVTLVGLTPEWMNPVACDFPIVRDHGRKFSVKPFLGYLDHVILVRRDRYVAATAPVADAAALQDAIAAIRHVASAPEPAPTTPMTSVSGQAAAPGARHGQLP